MSVIAASRPLLGLQARGRPEDDDDAQADAVDVRDSECPASSSQRCPLAEFARGVAAMRAVTASASAPWPGPHVTVASAGHRIFSPKTASRSATRIDPAVGVERLLELQRMLPVIPEIVAIADRSAAAGQVPGNWHLPAGKARSFVWELVVGNADSYDAVRFGIQHVELMEVIIEETHRILDSDVQIPERVGLWH
jgi:hypothetical protein